MKKLAFNLISGMLFLAMGNPINNAKAQSTHNFVEMSCLAKSALPCGITYDYEMENKGRTKGTGTSTLKLGERAISTPEIKGLGGIKLGSVFQPC